MKIVHNIGDEWFSAKTVEELKSEVQEFFSAHNVEATVEVVDDGVEVFIDDVHDIDAAEDMNIALRFCNSRQFGKAKKVLKEFLSKKPYFSDAHRLLAQIEMEEKNFGKAIDVCKDALRFDPKNLYALILLGNLYSRDLDDIKTGLKYFKKAYELDSDSALVVTNYAATLMRDGGNEEEQERLFRKAIKLAPDYLNSYYGLASILIGRSEFDEAFKLVFQGLRVGSDRPENPVPLKKVLTEILVRTARECMKSFDDELITRVAESVKNVSAVEVRIEADKNIAAPAKVELSTRYHREFHRLVYNPDKITCGHQFYILHELEKLLMRVETEHAGHKVEFASHVNGLKNFRDKTLSYVSEKFRKLIPESQMDGLLSQLMNGVGGQLMNCPLDFVTTKRVFDKYPDAHALQVVGAYQLIIGGLQSVQQGMQAGFPKNIVRLNRVMNTVSFMQYRDLFGIDFLCQLDVPKDELKQAEELYCKCLATVDKYYPGAEWELVRNFIAELKCGEFFKVLGVGDEVVETLRKEESVEIFHKNVEENPAIGASVMMYMVEAIRRLRTMDFAAVKRVAVEIAMLGMDGISPSKKSGYAVPSLVGEDMSGCRMLAYYYVSWALAIPEKVDALGLPFADEYEQAKLMADAGR